METPETNPKPENEEPAEPKQPVEPASDQPVEPEPDKAQEAAETRSAITTIDVPAPKPESGARRFFRSLVRWLILVVVLFGLGVLAAYFLLYRPLTVEKAGIQSNLQQTQQQLEQTRKDLAAAQAQSKEYQGQAQTAQASLQAETNRANLQTVLTDVFTARLALANKDGANAQAALQAAKTHLAALLPAVKEKDSARADAVSARLDLVMNELNRDPRTAASDLDILTRNLQELENVFKSNP